jgi:putative ABC transport system permease protein
VPVFEAVWLALGAIRAQKLKSFFSLIGVLIGVTFLIATISVIQGMNVYMQDRFANKLVGVNAYEVRRFNDFNAEDVPEDTWREWLRRPRVNYRESAFLADRVQTPTIWARTCFEDGIKIQRGSLWTRSAEIRAADEAYFRIKNLDIASGRSFTIQESKNGVPVTVIGDLVAQKLFPGVDPINKSIEIGDLPYRVVGVAERQGTLFGLSLDRFVVVPFTSPARRDLCGPNIVHELWAKAQDIPSMHASITEAEGLLRVARQLRPRQDNNFFIVTGESALGFWDKISRVLFMLLPTIVAISLVVGGIVIMNIMLVAVTERTREIGIRKALGARRRDILAQFIVESATLSTVGAIAGIGLGIALAFAVRALTPLPAAVATWSIGLAVLLGMVVGIIAGVYPAMRASKLDPIVALRAE